MKTAASRAAVLKVKSQVLLHRRNTSTQSRLVTGGGVFVERPLLDSLVERRDGLAICLLSSSFVAFFDGFPQNAQLGAQAGGIGAVAHGAAFGLARTFQRRKMICHSWFVTFV